MVEQGKMSSAKREEHDEVEVRLGQFDRIG
jgi:hypothetical protein